MKTTFYKLQLPLLTLALVTACADDGGSEGGGDEAETGTGTDTGMDTGTGDEIGTTADTTTDTGDTDTTTTTTTTTDTTTDTDTDTTTTTADTGTDTSSETGTGETGTDTDTGNASVCGDGVVEGDEVCDDGVNDGAYGGCNADCLSLAGFCGDGAVNGPEECDDDNDDLSDGCLGNCLIPTSCLDILEYDDQATDGDYMISPKLDTPWMTTCDMSTDGGGWTQISLPHLCNGDLDATLTAIEAAPEEGIDMMCRPFTRDAAGDHTYTFDVEFPPGFVDFYLDGFETQAYALNPDTSEIAPGDFIQTSWMDGHGGTFHGDVSFGSADDMGPVTSFAAEGADFECVSCTEPFPANNTVYAVGAMSTTLRLGWGEGGGQDEGWIPWAAGTIFVR